MRILAWGIFATMWHLAGELSRAGDLGKDLRLLRGGPGVVPGWVVEELRFLHPHLRPISMDFKNASIDMAARNGRSSFENQHFRIISRILAV